MKDICGVSVIIPSLNPTDRLEKVVCRLVDAGFDDIIVVNDGSRQDRLSSFETIRQMDECSVLTHKANYGKGRALKTAFKFILENRQGKIGAVTVDGDGQHCTNDVVRCALAMKKFPGGIVMGVRDFSKSTVPMRSWLGNRVTAFSMRVLFGITLRDTQTGLRAIPTPLIPLMLEIEGDRFEYETNMLVKLKRRNISLIEKEIETIYEQDTNERSNFKPFRDSIRIFASIAKCSMSRHK